MKFHVDALHSFKVILRTKRDGRTDRLTDESITIYHLSGGIKKLNQTTSTKTDRQFCHKRI